MKRILALLFAAALLGSVFVMVLAAPAPSADTDIRIMSQNLLNTPYQELPEEGRDELAMEHYTVNERAQLLLATIDEYAPAVIGFQEGLMKWRNILNANLTKYKVVEITEDFTDLIYYNPSEVTLKDSGVFWLSETPDVPSKQLDAAEERVCTWAVFTVNGSSKQFAMFNTHLDHVSEEARTFGMQVIHDKLEQFREEHQDKMPIVLTGDFNCTSGSAPYNAIVSAYSAASGLSMANSLWATPTDKIVNGDLTTIPGISLDKAGADLDGDVIDHVFVSLDQFNVKRHEVIEKYGYSDHFGLCVDLAFGPGQLQRTTQTNKVIAYGTPILDGATDAAYANTYMGVMDTYATYQDNGVDRVGYQTTGNYRFLYDDNYIYYFVNITHHNPAWTTGTYPGKDRVQPYFNYALDRQYSSSDSAWNTEWSTAADAEGGYFDTNTDGEPAYQFRRAAIAMSENDTAGDAFDYAVVKVADGYSVEGRFPMTAAMKAKVQADGIDSLGLGIQIDVYAHTTDTFGGDYAGHRDRVLYSENYLTSNWTYPNRIEHFTTGAKPVEGEAAAEKDYSHEKQHAAFGTATLDGVMDDAYLKGTPNTFHYINKGSLTSDTYRFLHDGENLYFFFDINDDVLVTNADESGYGYGTDGVRLFFDFLNTDFAEPGKPLPASQYSYSSCNAGGVTNAGNFIMFPGRYTVGVTDEFYVEDCDGSYIRSNVKYVVKTKTGGYYLEGSIPLSQAVKDRLAYGVETTIGLGAQVNDHDDTTGNNWKSYQRSYEYMNFGASPSVLPDVILEPAGHNKGLFPEDYRIAVSTGGASIGVDGVRDPAYDRANAVLINNHKENNNYKDLPADVSPVARFLYDGNYLYLLVEVQDSTRNVAADKNANANINKDHYNLDGISCYIDLSGNLNNTTYESDYSGFFHYNIIDKMASVQWQLGFDVQAASALTDDGYNVEMRFALPEVIRTALANSGTADIKIGVQVNDDTNHDGVRDQCYSTDASVDDAWYADGPRHLHKLTLAKDTVITESVDNLTISGNYAVPGMPVAPTLTVPAGYIVQDGTVFINEMPYTQGTPVIMPAGNVVLTASVVPESVGHPIFLPIAEGLTVTAKNESGQVITSAVAGTKVILDIQLADGYEFVQETGANDHMGDNFDTHPFGLAMMGRALKVNGGSIPWSGNSFTMPEGKAVITARTAQKPIAHASRNPVALDGHMDPVYLENAVVIDIDWGIYADRIITSDGSAATGKLYVTYDDEYLYCFVEVWDNTVNTAGAVSKDTTLDKSLLYFDSVAIFVDFLNSDSLNDSILDYKYVDGESGFVVLDALNQTTAPSGKTYEKFGGGFASLNADARAGYAVQMKTAGTASWNSVGYTSYSGYNVEVKLPLSDSFKQKLAAATSDNPPEIGIGAVIMDDRNQNGNWDYEKFDSVTCSSTQMLNEWSKLTNYVEADSIKLRSTTYGSPRWLNRIVLDGPVSYTIDYVLNGGTNAAGNPGSYTVTDSTITLTDPTRTGYSFTGWSESLSTTRWYFGSIFKDSPGYVHIRDGYPNSVYSERLYLKAGVTYTISIADTGTNRTRLYNLDGTYYMDAEGNTSITPDRDCYAVVSPMGGATQAQKNAMVIAAGAADGTVPTGSTGNRVFAANWQANTYTLTLNHQGGTGTNAFYEKYDDGFYADAGSQTAITAVAIPTRTGYTFDGYYTAENGGGTQVISAGGTILAGNNAFSADTILYAKWTANKYTVTLTPGTGAAVDPGSAEVTYLQPVPTLPTPTKPGYTFTAWEDGDGKVYAAGDIYQVAGPTTLYAKWQVNDYTLTFDPAGGIMEQGSETRTVTFDAPIGQLPQPVRYGYVFQGWYAADDSKMAAESLYTTADNSTLTAHWTPEDTTAEHGDTRLPTLVAVASLSALALAAVILLGLKKWRKR